MLPTDRLSDAIKTRDAHASKNHRAKKDENMDETGRLANFHRAVLFGPIFALIL